MTTRFTADHEYVRLEGDTAIVGITDHAQDKLGDVVFVGLPIPGRRLVKGEPAATVESAKAASDVCAPVTGEVVAVNHGLEGDPAAVNEDPAGRGWFLKMKVADPAELDGLMSEAAYIAFVAGA